MPKGYLVLSRKRDESLIFRIPGQDDICVTVIRVEGKNKVRLGIKASEDVVVLREELVKQPLAVLT